MESNPSNAKLYYDDDFFLLLRRSYWFQSLLLRKWFVRRANLFLKISGPRWSIQNQVANELALRPFTSLRWKLWRNQRNTILPQRGKNANLRVRTLSIAHSGLCSMLMLLTDRLSVRNWCSSSLVHSRFSGGRHSTRHNLPRYDPVSVRLFLNYSSILSAFTHEWCEMVWYPGCICHTPSEHRFFFKNIPAEKKACACMYVCDQEANDSSDLAHTCSHRNNGKRISDRLILLAVSVAESRAVNRLISEKCEDTAALKLSQRNPTRRPTVISRDNSFM